MNTVAFRKARTVLTTATANSDVAPSSQSSPQRQVLLTVSGVIPPTIEAGILARRRPRADYFEIACRMHADIIDYAAAREMTGRAGRLLEKIGGPNLTLAYACWLLRRRYRAILTDGEQVGLPLAGLFRLSSRARPRHIMITHVISPKKKVAMIHALGLTAGIDRFVVYCRKQSEFILDRWRLGPDRVACIPFMVDADFFDPAKVTRQRGPRPRICSVGLERRDYPTLLNAIDGLDVDVVIAAASPWSKRSDGISGGHVPSNVTVRRFDQYELRQLYADCDMMVMPLQNVDFQAGVTAILEAMAMGKPVLCSQTSGQTDVIVEGENGSYVPVGDASALRSRIVRLLAAPEDLARMGTRAREGVVRNFTLDHYTERLLSILQGAMGESGAIGSTTGGGGNDEFAPAAPVASSRSR